jgi:hypothetical protein
MTIICNTLTKSRGACWHCKDAYQTSYEKLTPAWILQFSRTELLSEHVP